MSAEVPKWLVAAQRDLTASKTEEQKEKAKTKNQKRKEVRKRRVARKREAKLAKLLMGRQEHIDKVQVDMRELIDAEKQKSERFLSLARKYYRMWKTLNEKCQEKGVWKSPKGQVQYSTSNVSFSRSKRWRRQNQDRTGPDRTGPDHRKKKLKKKNPKKIKSFIR